MLLNAQSPKKLIKPMHFIHARHWLILSMVLLLGGCSRIGLVYNSSEFLIQRYVNGYINLSPEQREQWRPQLKAALAAHRAEDLPAVAAFIDQLRQLTQGELTVIQLQQLRTELDRLYRQHARRAVDLAAPLLAELNSAQIDALARRFERDRRKAQDKLDDYDPAQEVRKRRERYVENIADWTGELSDAQQVLIGEIAARIPHSQAAFNDYRFRQRTRLIALLRSGADESTLNVFLSQWLIEFRDQPPAMAQAWIETETLIKELMVRLVATLDDQQRARLDERLGKLHQDVVRLTR